MPYLIKTALFIFITFSTYSPFFAQNAFVYDHGTNWQASFYNIINSSDPSTFKKALFEGEKNVEMWDRDANDNNGAWINPISWVFALTYNDGITSEIRIRKLGFTKDQGIALAEKYGKRMGQLPACLREGVDYINILKSDALFGGNNFKRSIEITIGETSELYERTGNMEETLFHESTHAALDYLYQEDWILQRDKDSKYISKYAADHPNREDISESFLLYAAVNYRENRISSEVEKIKQNISKRLEFYKNLKLNMHPFSKKETDTSDNFDINAFYRITNQWQGDGKSLDINEDEKNNQPILSEMSNIPSQMWQIKKNGVDSYLLSTKKLGSTKVLTCLPGENQNLLRLDRESTYSGDVWKIIPVGNGFYRITNVCLNDYSLDIVNDGKNNQIKVAKTGSYSGQYWKISRIE